ncbi:DUF5694 domain-containing protein [Ekhidna sp.]|uniref:DUF5694 domain-containing protein n=1 Tax=Ekhidna sp. TaxID=2608089 RepID=UPI003BAC6FAF
MKNILASILIGISVLASGQDQLNVTIIGTAHYFNPDYQTIQNFGAVQDFILELNPDIFCIESIPVNDTLSLQEIWPNTMKRADKLKDSLRAYSIADVGATYYANYDFWNAYYQWHLKILSGDSSQGFSKYHKDQSNSEFGLMIFPAAQKLGIPYLYGIDYRDGEGEFMSANNKVLKRLFFSLKWKPLRIYLKTQKRYKKAEKTGQLIEFINSPEFQDAFSSLIDNLPQRLPKSEEAKFIKAYWLNRNKVMAERIVETAQVNGARKVLLTVGSAHVTHIQRFLEEMGHSVTTYGQILNNSNN